MQKLNQSRIFKTPTLILFVVIFLCTVKNTIQEAFMQLLGQYAHSCSGLKKKNSCPQTGKILSKRSMLPVYQTRSSNLFRSRMLVCYWQHAKEMVFLTKGI